MYISSFLSSIGKHAFANNLSVVFSMKSNQLSKSLLEQLYKGCSCKVLFGLHEEVCTIDSEDGWRNSWVLTSDNTLTVSSNGVFTDFAINNDSEWRVYGHRIQTIKRLCESSESII